MKRDKRFKRYAQKLISIAGDDVKRIDTGSAGIGTTVGSQTFSTITFSSSSSVNRVNTNLFQPYSAPTLLSIAEEVPEQTVSVSNEFNPSGGYNFKCMIKFQKIHVTVHNPNNSTVKLKLLSCKARKNMIGPGIHSGWDTPEEMLYKGWNLKTTVGATLSTVYTSTVNVRQDITVYDSPIFCQHWKVRRTKSWILKPGATIVVQIPFKNFRTWKMSDYYYDTLSVGSPMWNWLQGDYMYLWNIKGEEGVSALASAPTLFNYPTTTQVSVTLKLARRYAAGAIRAPFAYTQQDAYNWAKDATSTGSINSTYSSITSGIAIGRTDKAGIINENAGGGVTGAWVTQLIT